MVVVASEPPHCAKTFDSAPVGVARRADCELALCLDDVDFPVRGEGQFVESSLPAPAAVVVDVTRRQLMTDRMMTEEWKRVTGL